MLAREKSIVLVLSGLLLAAGNAFGDVTIFGLDHSPIGAGTLTPNSTGTLTVGNLGSSGQDGVSVDISTAQVPGQVFAFDAAVSFNPGPVGSYMQWTAMGTVGGGTTQVISSARETELGSSDYQIVSDFSAVSNGQPLTIDYYSGGPGGTLVYSEQYSGTSPTLAFLEPVETEWTDTIGLPPLSSSGGDTNGAMQVITAGGITLPIADGIDFFDILAPTNVQPKYSSIALTAGGGISSFTVTGESLMVPEPGQLALLGLSVISGLRCRARDTKSK